MADAILAGPSGSKIPVYIGLSGYTAAFGSLTVTPVSKNTSRITVSAATSVGAATIKGNSYADGDAYKFIATAANDDVDVTVDIDVTVVGTDYSEPHCVQIERKACR